jgi:hypothetical protein
VTVFLPGDTGKSDFPQISGLFKRNSKSKIFDHGERRNF